MSRPASDDLSPRPDLAHGGPPTALDPAAIARAMEALRPYLLRVANEELDPALRPKEGASDVVQQAYLAALSDPARLREQAPTELKQWLRGLLLSKMSHVVRRYKSTDKRKLDLEVSIQAGGPAEENGFDPTARDATPSREVIRREERARVLAAIDRLKEPDRQVVKLRHEERLAWAEIGDRIGGSEDMVQKVYSRAIMRLRRELEDPPVDRA